MNRMKKTGELFIEAIDESRLNRTFLYKMLNLHETWDTYRTLNTARLYYVAVRNVKDQTLRAIMLEKLSKHQYLSNQSYIPILVGYAALKTRARKEEEEYA